MLLTAKVGSVPPPAIGGKGPFLIQSLRFMNSKTISLFLGFGSLLALFCAHSQRFDWLNGDGWFWSVIAMFGLFFMSVFAVQIMPYLKHKSKSNEKSNSSFLINALVAIVTISVILFLIWNYHRLVK